MFQYYNGNFIPIESIFRKVLIFYSFLCSWFILLPGLLSTSIAVLPFQTWLTVLLHAQIFYFYLCLILRGVYILSWFYKYMEVFHSILKKLAFFLNIRMVSKTDIIIVRLLHLVRKNITQDSLATLPYFLEVGQGWIETVKREVSFEQHNFGIRLQPSLINYFRAKKKRASNCIIIWNDCINLLLLYIMK